MEGWVVDGWKDGCWRNERMKILVLEEWKDKSMDVVKMKIGAGSIEEQRGGTMKRWKNKVLLW